MQKLGVLFTSALDVIHAVVILGMALDAFCCAILIQRLVDE